MKIGKKILFVINADWAFLSHRLILAKYAMKEGYDIIVTAIEERGLGDKIRSHGFKFVPLPANRSSTNIFLELRIFLFLFDLFRKEKPDIIHNVTLKPVAYGSIVSRFFSKINVVNTITGFGTIFIDKNSHRFSRFMLNYMLRVGLKKNNIKVTVQNEDDFHFIKNLKIVKNEDLLIIDGSGIDLELFKYSPEPESEVIKILFPARMMRDKGLFEFEEAARVLKIKFGDKIDLILAGNIDVENKTSVDEKLLLNWSAEGHVKWIGDQTNMPELLSRSHIVVMPSYQEGLPKSLMEACAVGRPIVTTDVPGCRDVVQDNYNGFLVPVKNSAKLATAIEKLIIDKDLRINMGKRGYELAVERFDCKITVNQTIELYRTFYKSQ